jgi:type VI protein secretion system component VasK
MILFLACALLVGLFAGGWLGWYAADVRTADTDARIKALEGQVATARQIADASGERYLRRLRLCSGCVTCNLEPQGPGDPDYDVKLIGDTP